MRIYQDLLKNKPILLFLLFWFFSILGSNVYIGVSMLSVRNLLFPALFVVILILRKVQLSKTQKIISLPLLLFYLYGVLSLFFHGNFNIDIIKDFFYFTFIPVIFISIILLANNYGDKFFFHLKWFSHFLLYFLFAFTLFELITGIHLPVHAVNSYNIPSAFFTNANDLAVISIQLLFLVFIFRKKEDKVWQYIVPFIMTGFIVFTTLSRLGLASYIIVSLTVFMLKAFNWKNLLLNIILIGSILTFMNIDIPTSKSSSTVVDRSKIRVNSMTHIEEESQKKESSVSVRLDIYKIAFLQPKDFIFGHGFNSDKSVIENYKTLDYKIINSHSFFIQTIFYFGWIGLILLIAFFGVLMYFSLFSSPIWGYLISIIITQALLINIPSSIMRFPLIWIPFFIAVAYYTYNNYKRNNTVIEERESDLF